MYQNTPFKNETFVIVMQYCRTVFKTAAFRGDFEVLALYPVKKARQYLIMSMRKTIFCALQRKMSLPESKSAAKNFPKRKHGSITAPQKLIPPSIIELQNEQNHLLWRPDGDLHSVCSCCCDYGERHALTSFFTKRKHRQYRSCRCLTCFYIL